MKTVSCYICGEQAAVANSTFIGIFGEARAYWCGCTGPDVEVEDDGDSDWDYEADDNSFGTAKWT